MAAPAELHAESVEIIDVNGGHIAHRRNACTEYTVVTFGEPSLDTGEMA